MSHEQTTSIVAQIQQVQRLEQLMAENGLADQPVGAAAREAAYASVDGLIREAPEVVQSITDKAEVAATQLDNLTNVRKQLVDLGLSTDEVDDRISETEITEDEKSLLHYFTGRQVFILAEVETVPVPEPAPEVAETVIRGDVSIGFALKEDRPILQIGERRINLESGHENRAKANFALIKFAVVSVLSQLKPGEMIRVNRLWDQVQAQFSDDDRQLVLPPKAMSTVNKFALGLAYRRKQIFIHNGFRGETSAYGINPELGYNVQLKDEDGGLTEFAALLHDRYEAKISGKEKTLPTDGNKTEVIVPEELPNRLELNSFLAKLQAVIPKLNVTEDSYLTTLLGVVDQAIDDIEEDTEDAEVVTMRQEVMDIVRSGVAEKFIHITEDDELLNKLLENQDSGLLDQVYGSKVAVDVVKLVEILLDMSSEEKHLLRDIITADGDLQVTLDGGGHSKGIQIIGAKVVYDVDSGLYAAVESPEKRKKTFITVDPENFDSASTADNIETMPPPPAETETKAASVDAVSKYDAEQTHQRRRRRGNAAKAISKSGLIQTVVDGTLKSLLEKGMKPGTSYTAGQLANILGISLNEVVNARRSTADKDGNVKAGQTINLEHAVMVALTRNTEERFKAIMESPQNKRTLRRTVRQAIRNLDDPKTKAN